MTQKIGILDVELFIKPAALELHLYLQTSWWENPAALLRGICTLDFLVCGDAPYTLESTRVKIHIIRLLNQILIRYIVVSHRCIEQLCAGGELLTIQYSIRCKSLRTKPKSLVFKLADRKPQNLCTVCICDQTNFRHATVTKRKKTNRFALILIAENKNPFYITLKQVLNRG